MGRTFFLTLTAMLAFAGNSLLCRAALSSGRIDASSFTTIRVVAGALTLWLIVGMRSRSRTRVRNGKREPAGNWSSALALFIYAAAFSFAYVSLTAATGALLLFGAVQVTMIGFGLRRGERLQVAQTAGLVCALVGLVGLLLPGLAAPPLWGSVLMLAAGSAWGAYSLRGKGSGDPLRVTAGNFMRAVVFAAALSALTLPWASFDGPGVGYAIASGSVTSGIGYVVWYAVLPRLKMTSAATVQLSVPVIAAAGGMAFLGEPLTLRLVIASVAILGGIAFVVVTKPTRRT